MALKKKWTVIVVGALCSVFIFIYVKLLSRDEISDYFARDILGVSDYLVVRKENVSDSGIKILIKFGQSINMDALLSRCNNIQNKSVRFSDDSMYLSQKLGEYSEVFNDQRFGLTHSNKIENYFQIRFPLSPPISPGQEYGYNWDVLIFTYPSGIGTDHAQQHCFAYIEKTWD